MRAPGSLVDNFIFNLLKTFFRLAFPVLSFTYAARILGQDGIGKVSFSTSVVTLFTLLATLGMDFYGTREAAKLRDDRDGLSKFAHEVLFINICTTVAAYALLAASLYLVPKFHGYESVILISSLAIGLQGLGMEWLYQAVEDYRYISLRTILFQGLALIVMLLFVRTTDDVEAYAAVLVTASSGSFLLNFFNARHYVNFKPYSDYHIAKHLRPLLWLFAMAASIEVYVVLDHTMLGFMQGDAAVGRYTAAVKVNKAVIALITAVGAVLIPRFSYYIGRGQWEKMRTLLKKAYNYTFLFSVPCAAGLFVLSDEIIRLFSGSGFAAAGFTMRIMTPIVLFIPFSVATNQHTLIPMGKEKLLLAATCTGAGVNLACNTLLIPRFAENGAAAATVIAEAAVALVSYRNIRKYIDMGPVFKSSPHYLLASLPIFLFAWLGRALPFRYPVRMSLVMTASVLCYPCILYLLRNEYYLEAVRILEQKLGGIFLKKQTKREEL